MLRYVITFLVLTLVAGVFAFTGIADGVRPIAHVLFYIFMVFFLVSLITGAFKRTDDDEDGEGYDHPGSEYGGY